VINLAFFITLVFGYKIGYVDYSILIPGIILLSQVLYKLRIKKSLPKSLLNLILFLLFIAFISMFSMLINDKTLVAEYTLKPFRVILLMLISWLYININKLTFLDILKNISYLSFIHAIVIFLQYALDVTGINSSFFYNPIIEVSSPYRKVGLSTGYPSAGVVLIFGSLVSLYLHYYLKLYKFFIIFLAISGAIFFTARSAMYLYILIIPLYMTYLSFYYKKFKVIYIYLFVITLITILIYLFFTPLFQGTINKMGANIINYMQTGSFMDYSLEHLFSERHIYFPNDVKTLLFGDYLGREHGFKTSDIGYIKILNANGLFSWLGYIGSYMLMYLYSYNRIKRTNDKPLINLLHLTYLVFFIMQFKTNYFHGRIVGDLVIIISFLCIYSSFNDNFELRKNKSKP